MDVDLAKHAETAIERAVGRGIGDADWRIRVRESQGRGTKKDTVETASASMDVDDLSGIFADIIARRTDEEFASHIHLEMLQTGDASPFFSFTVKVNDEPNEIQHGEAGAMMALAKMGWESNNLLRGIVRDQNKALTSARHNEMQAATVLAEMFGRQSAEADGGHMAMAAQVIQALGPAALEMLKVMAAQAAAQEEASRAARAASEKEERAEGEA